MEGSYRTYPASQLLFLSGGVGSVIQHAHFYALYGKTKQNMKSV